jgi:hypothetical protein
MLNLTLTELVYVWIVWFNRGCHVNFFFVKGPLKGCEIVRVIPVTGCEGP